MERPTIELILPESKIKVTLYSFLTNGDYRKIKRITYSGMKLTVDREGKTDTQELNGSFVIDAEEAALLALIKEVCMPDGTKVTDVSTLLNQLSMNDGKFLYDESDRLTGRSYLSNEQKKN